MGLSIISKSPVDKYALLKSIENACANKEIRCELENADHSEDERAEVYIENRYNNDDEFPNYFYMDILPIKEQIELFNISPIKSSIGSKLYYMLTGTDQADYDHLMYDFSLAYLRLNPDHLISLYDENLFTLGDMEKLESEGGYYKDWCFGVSRPN